MAADYTAYNAVLKEVWVSDKLEEQIYTESPFLDKIERGEPQSSVSTAIGDYAIVGVHTGRSGGYSAVPRTGSSSLNPADEQKLNQAQYVWTNHWFQIKVEESTAKETKGKPKAIASAVDLEVTGAIADLRKQLTRQMLGGDGTGKICPCGTTTSSTTVVLGSLGAQAIARNWLYVGLTIDIGTSGSEASLADAVTITAVDPSAGTITISGSAITTTSSHYVSIANARSGATSYEANGLRNIVGTATLGGINPSTEPGWQSTVNTTAQDLGLPALYAMRRAVRQQTGGKPDWSITSLKQEEALYKLLQVQARFTGDSGFDVGNVETVKFAGMEIDAEPDVLDGDWFALTKKDLFAVREGGPEWQSGSSGNPLEWQQGTTAMVGGLVYHFNLAAKRRNSHAAYTAFN